VRELLITIFIFVDHHTDSVKLDCTLLILAGLGVYVYGMFSIMGSIFAMQDGEPGERRFSWTLKIN
jgi:hypothetical protein